MPIDNSGSDHFETASIQMLEGLQRQRSGLLGTTIDIHVGIGLLAGVEAGRLAQKYGAGDARVRLLRDRGEAAAMRVNALSVEREIAMVRTPPPPATGALIHGRITDMMRRAAGRVSVQPIDEKGEAVDGVEPVETDDAGYFAFELKPKTVTAICTKLSLLLRAAEVQLVPAAAKPITVAPGASVVMEVPLSTAELERLRLRIPVAVNTVTVPVPNGYGTAAAYKAQAAKAAADKVDADKAAAHQAAAGKAAAHKAAADKADAEKAAADKAAADLAAATKPAADEAAADQEAADKSAAKPPTRGGTTGKKR